MIDKNRWETYTFYQQMGNIASEISRTVRFEEWEDTKHTNASLWRTLELVDLTIEDKKNTSRLGELCRFREVLVDRYCRTGVYDVRMASLKDYALHFAMLAV